MTNMHLANVLARALGHGMVQCSATSTVVLHRGIIALFGSWGLQATKLWNLWNLSHFTYTSLPTEGNRCNTSSVVGTYSDLAIAEYFESYRL